MCQPDVTRDTTALHTAAILWQIFTIAVTDHGAYEKTKMLFAALSDQTVIEILTNRIMAP